MTISTAPQPTADISQGLSNLERFGYTIHPGWLDAPRLQALSGRLEEQARLERETSVAETQDELGRRQIGEPLASWCWQGVRALVNKGREFIDCALDPLLLDYMRGLFGAEPFYLVQATGVVVRRGSRGQVVHSDQQAIPFRTPVPVYANAMVCLTDFLEDMGATRVVPGSHLGSAPPIAAVSDDQPGLTVNAEPIETIPTVCEAGSVIIFEGRLWHGQGAASSERTRYSIINGYAMYFMAAQDNYVASLHEDVYATLTNEERALLGFQVVKGYTGHYYPRYPGDTRSNTELTQAYIPELRSSPRMS
jgi:ectoine hydroxylase-related dioxygenase (phytanoyl-CoA dioxygenase family)